MCLGEVMLELRPVDGRSELTLGFAGDSLNTAVMLSRHGVNTGYITRLGSDHFSQQIIRFANEQALDTCGIDVSGQSLPGLYLIQNDEPGERDFFYRRERSPARQMFESQASCAAIINQVSESQWLYLSGITTAVMGLYAETNSLNTLNRIKAAGVNIAYDPNYRPLLWQSKQEAQRWHTIMLHLSDMVLPTFIDEQALWGGKHPQVLIERCSGAGVTHVVAKCPGAHALTWCGGELVELQLIYLGPVVDTTGAGDACNAGYLAAFLADKTPTECLENAHNVASTVLSVRGALP